MADALGRIGRYTVVRDLGSGGMGEVFLAHSPAGSPVAVKVIRSDRLDAGTRARFEREALIARTVIGTNRVARFLDADPYADRPWLAMEYVPGRTLLKYVEEHGVLPLALVASLGALLTEGLEAVHAVGLLHRDLKPQNIILGTDGPMIIDFGLGAFLDTSQDSLSHTGMIIGTVRCMPPEQASGNPHVTPAADVYALGTVLLFAATGHYPYDGTRWEAIAAQVSSPQAGPNLDGTPEALIPLLESMMSYDPADRPSLAAIADACASLLDNARMTPASARLALIAQTAEPDGSRPAFSPSVESLMEALGPGDEFAETSPLDAPWTSEGTETTSEAAPTAGTVQDDPGRDATTTPSGRQRPRPNRPTASVRVADELRAAYAARPTL